MAANARPSRRAKLTNVDYAVLTSGMQIPEFSSEEEASADESWGAKRHRRQASSTAAKRRRRDTEASPSLASSPSGSGDLDSAGNSPMAAPARRRTAKPKTCFVCRKPNGRGGVFQCDICARWFHDNCRRTDDVRSVLANTSCHDCLKESVVTAKSALPRQQLDSIADLVAILKRAKKVLVVAGAGISVSCGIPDFRSKDGIYEMVKHMDVALPEPECLFHIDYFREDPSPFFQLVQNVFGHSPAPSPTHQFLKLLQDKGKLLRVYSQNIDGLEAVAGVTKYLPCHGSFAWSSCMRCRARVDTQSILPVIQAGVIPTCSALNCRGVLKPEITFFGEILSDDVSTSITKDRLEADLLLVMGTSLKVSPVAEIPSFVPRHIPQVVINKTPLKKKKLKTDKLDPEPFDLQLLGDCDTIVKLLCDDAKWTLGPKTTEPSSDASTKKAKKAKRIQPTLIPHHSLKRVCVGQCECAGVPDGALWANKTKNGDGGGDDEESQVDVVVCDACGEPMDDEDAGAVSYSCIDCFDYDLCSACHPRVSKSHFDGAHHFQKVRSSHST